MTIKAKELASMLNISEATLSLVLNHKRGISDKTREKVSKQIVDMGYEEMFKDKPDMVSEENVSGEKTISNSALPTEKGNIGFVIYKNTGHFIESTPFFPLIIDGMDITARKNGYKLLTINIRRDMDLQTKIGYLRESGCEGFVIYAPELPEDDADAFLNLQMPIVLLDNFFYEKNMDSVVLNNSQGIYIVLKKLMELGHRKIGYLGSGVNIQSYKERKENYIKFMNEFGLEIDERYVADIGYPEQQSIEGMIKLIEKNKDYMPTAFVADTDYVAYGAIKALQKMGYRVPDDVSVVGFSDRPVCIYCEPKIATMRIPRFRFGAEAVDLLINKIINNSPEERSFVKTEVSMEFVMRESVGIARI